MTRLSRKEMNAQREGVKLMFNAPSDRDLDEVDKVFERIQGRRASTRQVNYLIRIYRIHGPATARLIEEVYAERGSTENLLLAVECHPPGSSQGAWAPGDATQDPIDIT